MAKRFPYETVETGFPTVDKLIAVIQDLPHRDWSNTIMGASYAVNALGQEAGFDRHKTPEERAVASALKRIFCGPRTAHYAWRLYARYRQGGQLSARNITY